MDFYKNKFIKYKFKYIHLKKKIELQNSLITDVKFIMNEEVFIRYGNGDNGCIGQIVRKNEKIDSLEYGLKIPGTYTIMTLKENCLEKKNDLPNAKYQIEQCVLDYLGNRKNISCYEYSVKDKMWYYYMEDSGKKYMETQLFNL